MYHTITHKCTYFNIRLEPFRLCVLRYTFEIIAKILFRYIKNKTSIYLTNLKRMKLLYINDFTKINEIDPFTDQRP